MTWVWWKGFDLKRGGYLLLIDLSGKNPISLRLSPLSFVQQQHGEDCGKSPNPFSFFLTCNYTLTLLLNGQT